MVVSKRGFIKAKAVVTKRLQTLTIDGRTVNTIGIPVTGVLRGRPGKVPGEHADAFSGRCEFANSGIQSFPVNVEKV
jgi:formate dehydrogenase major subunit/formate dehydrogenase-N alpha subunit